MTTEQAIEYFGSRAKLAEALGISIFAIYKKSWEVSPPPLRQYQLEKLTEGALIAEV